MQRVGFEPTISLLRGGPSTAEGHKAASVKCLCLQDICLQRSLRTTRPSLLFLMVGVDLGRYVGIEMGVGREGRKEGRRWGGGRCDFHLNNRISMIRDIIM